MNITSENSRRRLLVSTQNDDDEDDDSVVIDEATTRCRWKTTILEPLTFMFIFAWEAFAAIKLQYAYHAIAVKLDPNKTHHIDDRSTSSLCRDNVSDDFQDLVQGSTTDFCLQLQIAYTIPLLFSIFIQTSLSDLYGRRLAFFVALVGNGISFLVLFLVVRFRWPLDWLFAGELASGLGGSVSGVSGAYVADVSTPERRSFRLGILYSGIFLFVGAASLVVNEWLDVVGEITLVMFVPILVLQTASLFYLIFVEESVATSSAAKRIGVWGNIKKFTSLIIVDARVVEARLRKQRRRSLTPPPSGVASRVLNAPLLIPFAAFLCSVVLTSGVNIVTLFLMNHPLCWGPGSLGILNVAGIIYQCVVVILASRFLVPRFGDASLVALSMVSGAVSYIMLAFSTDSWMIVIWTTLSGFKLVSMPILKSMMTKVTPEEAYGSLFACLGVVEMATILGFSLLFSKVYELTISIFPGLVFILFSFVYCVGLLLILILWYKYKEGEISDTEVTGIRNGISGSSDHSSTIDGQTYKIVDASVADS